MSYFFQRRCWLLQDHAMHPETNASISIFNRINHLLEDCIDFAIRRGPGNYPGLEVEKLPNDHRIPIYCTKWYSRRNWLLAKTNACRREYA